MASVYEMTPDPDVEALLYQMRKGLAPQFGVTVTGNRCTLRWYEDGVLVDVHMIIESVTTPKEAKKANERLARMENLFRKYPDLREEFHHAETGEWSK